MNARRFLKQKYKEHMQERFGRDQDQAEVLEASYHPDEWVVNAMEEYAEKYGMAIINSGTKGINLHRSIYRGDKIECSKKEYYDFVKKELANIAKEFLGDDLFMCAKHAMDERERLNRKFNFDEEE